MASLISSIRLAIATLLVCVVGYTAVIWGVGRVLAADAAQGSLIATADGALIGSRLIAQKFTQPRYFWPRPSAVDHSASGAAGSNKSPTSTDLTGRATQIVAQHGATAANPLPPELAAASGSGLDPHISERAARFQAARVARARRIPVSEVEALVARHALAPGGLLTSDGLVNVLELNLALDRDAAR